MAQTPIQNNTKNKVLALEASKNFSAIDTTYINLLNTLAQENYFKNNDSLYLLSKKALTLSKKANYEYGNSKSLLGIGQYYASKGQLLTAISNFEEALSTIEGFHFPLLKFRILNELASTQNHQGNLAKALETLMIALDFAIEEDQKYWMSIAMDNIGSLYSSLKDYDQGIEYYKNSLQVQESLGNELISAETQSNLAAALVKAGRLEEALTYVDRSIETFKNTYKIGWLSFCYETKGEIYLAKKLFNSALYWFKKGAQLHDRFEDKKDQISIFNGMAKSYLGLYDTKSAEQYATQALTISKQINFMEGIRQSSKLLYQLNKLEQNFEASLYFHEQYMQLSDSISREENQKALSIFKTQKSFQQQREALIKENEKALAQQRLYIYIALAFLFIMVVVSFLIARGKKIQKNLIEELNKQKKNLELRKEELQSANDTKNKLFSIIAHDLRGPMGALDGLLALFMSGDLKNSEFKALLPKLKADVNNLSFTLNNLLSWGKTQLNGTTTTRTNTNLHRLVNDNIVLLHKLSDSKSITIENTLPKKTMLWSDKDQLDIVIRNLLSNAIKFTPNNGKITVGAKDINGFLEVFIRDSGVGMTKDIQKKILLKDSHFTTYGTNHEKGTGLGLSLCKEMLARNGGSLQIQSKPGEGSTFYFTIPKGKKALKKTA
ncbi:sensor histidine kinase [Arenibacter sp. 6A1]|uniref:tetratricopeptide repeat-containing sensor histidine kinase n=1 Tax=Arenibacter sp. 6A1 TaxID=2720391 RepID=UPI0014489852|nr:tetratricopeptide repeat-containing sensor histidine kinase [Arenibacter sp. 6A1]NKI26908.1 sensor histidine kinase [Arenibacter sp. 6A1]